MSLSARLNASAGTSNACATRRRVDSATSTVPGAVAFCSGAAKWIGIADRLAGVDRIATTPVVMPTCAETPKVEHGADQSEPALNRMDRCMLESRRRWPNST